MPQTCIIIGASHAAAQLVLSLRQEGWTGKITVIGDEASLPYQHPPLSKTFLRGDKAANEIFIRPQAFYEKHNIDFILETRVESIHPASKSIILSSGEILKYDKLALCTGSRVRQLTLPGVELNGVHYLRTLRDGEGIKSDMTSAKEAVIVGGGYIGLETAASLKTLGIEVTVVEMASRVLARVTAPVMAEFYTRMHQEEGVVIKTGVTVSTFEGKGKIERVICTDGSHLNTDLVVIGVGIIPNVELAEVAGLDVDNGILVDEFARTNDPDIVAAGDCTNHPNALYGQHLRLESVPNALEQPKSAAASICGKEKAYNALPWFWSDQYDLKLKIAGLSQGHDQVVIRGDKNNSRSFVAFYLKSGKLIAADCVNRPREFLVCKRLIASGSAIDVARLKDENTSPEDFAI
ncbi:MAG: FAD-dependent oxidoreductase [Proteobacteria bacterium]|nr:FAD-dependent oxidoreductase [Pseudomonadota bacterium]MCH8056798.1 FAD-dependent oxidoreductase [Pseudomonadota bacterium]